jgi:hypothetical protein
MLRKPCGCVKSAKSHFFSVEGQTQLLEARMHPAAAIGAPPAGDFAFPTLTEEPEADFESIHANKCYDEQ